MRLALAASEVPYATCDLGAILTAHGLIHPIAFRRAVEDCHPGAFPDRTNNLSNV